MAILFSRSAICVLPFTYCSRRHQQIFERVKSCWHGKNAKKWLAWSGTGGKVDSMRKFIVLWTRTARSAFSPMPFDRFEIFYSRVPKFHVVGTDLLRTFENRSFAVRSSRRSVWKKIFDNVIDDILQSSTLCSIVLHLNTDNDILLFASVRRKNGGIMSGTYCLIIASAICAQ